MPVSLMIWMWEKKVNGYGRKSDIFSAGSRFRAVFLKYCNIQLPRGGNFDEKKL